MGLDLGKGENTVVENISYAFSKGEIKGDPVIIDKLFSVLSQELLDEIRVRAIENTENVYRLTWTGSSKTPYSRVLLGNDMELLLLQHGQVYVKILSAGEKQIVGTYKRIKEYKGSNNNEHEVIIFIKKK